MMPEKIEYGDEDFVIFMCKDCVKSKYKTRRPPGTEPIIIMRGKCPICKKGSINSPSLNLWGYINWRKGRSDKERLEIKEKIFKDMEKYNIE